MSALIMKVKKTFFLWELCRIPMQKFHAASEFDVQGLELDWTCLVWEGAHSGAGAVAEAIQSVAGFDFSRGTR